MSTEARLKAANEIIADQNRALAVAHANAPLTPMDMLNRAVANGADIDILEKLMGLQERWEANQARKAFEEAMAAAKAEMPLILKNREVDFTSQKGRTHYFYEDLSSVTKAVTPILARHGLSYRFRTSSPPNEPITVTCIISHRMGHCEENTLCGPRDDTGNKNSIQQVGSTLTYLQRMTLKAALGLAAAKDDDARSSEASDGVVSDQQADELRALLTETKSDLDRFLKWAGAESVSDIPSGKYNDCMALLNAKKKKGAAQ